MYVCVYSVYVLLCVLVAALRRTDHSSKESCIEKITELKKMPGSNKKLSSHWWMNSMCLNMGCIQESRGWQNPGKFSLFLTSVRDFVYVINKKTKTLICNLRLGQPWNFYVNMWNTSWLLTYTALMSTPYS
jgi:hypothetical protein